MHVQSLSLTGTKWVGSLLQELLGHRLRWFHEAISELGLGPGIVVLLCNLDSERQQELAIIRLDGCVWHLYGDEILC